MSRFRFSGSVKFMILSGSLELCFLASRSNLICQVRASISSHPFLRTSILLISLTNAPSKNDASNRSIISARKNTMISHSRKRGLI